MVKRNFKISENGIGFMSGRLLNSFNKSFRNSDGKIGVFFCDSQGNLIHISPDEIIWHTDIEFSMKREVNGLLITRNEVIKNVR